MFHGSDLLRPHRERLAFAKARVPPISSVWAIGGLSRPVARNPTDHSIDLARGSLTHVMGNSASGALVRRFHPLENTLARKLRRRRFVWLYLHFRRRRQVACIACWSIHKRRLDVLRVEVRRRLFSTLKGRPLQTAYVRARLPSRIRRTSIASRRARQPAVREHLLGRPTWTVGYSLSSRHSYTPAVMAGSIAGRLAISTRIRNALIKRALSVQLDRIGVALGLNQTDIVSHSPK